MTLLVTGGAGFIGANFVLGWLADSAEPVINLDKLAYSGNRGSLRTLEGDPRHRFVVGDIGDRALVGSLLAEHRPRAIVHFAAESHVDRSIHGADAFVQTNLVGTFELLEAVRAWWQTLPAVERGAFRLLHVSTDEVYGTLGPADPPFHERTPYAPNSPYAASKAGADMLVRAWHRTYGLPTIITNCSNNYGPLQFPEKLIPVVILAALAGRPVPVYGDGMQIRDWLHVHDHCNALRRVLAGGQPGEVYNIGGVSDVPNIELVRMICAELDRLRPDAPHRPHASLIHHVTDRPGHDRRYAVDAAKIRRELGWQPSISLGDGIAATVRWYVEHGEWVESVTSGAYRDWMKLQYGTGAPS